MFNAKIIKQAICYGSIDDVLKLWNESERNRRFIRRYLKVLKINYLVVKNS